MGRNRNDIAQRFADAFNARAFPDELLADDVLVENVPTAVTDRVYHGRDGVERWMRDLLDAYDDDARFGYEVVAEGPDYVVARLSVAGRGSASGVPLDLRWTGVIHHDGERVSRAVGFARTRDALASVGGEG